MFAVGDFSCARVDYSGFLKFMSLERYQNAGQFGVAFGRAMAGAIREAWVVGVQ